jgi:hypothetical protein
MLLTGEVRDVMLGMLDNATCVDHYLNENGLNEMFA